MDGMRERKVVLQNPENPGVGGGSLDEVDGGGEGVVAFEDVLEYGVVPLDDDGGVSDAPLEDLALGLGGSVEGDGEGGRGKEGRGDGALDDWGKARLARAGGCDGCALVGG